MPDPIPRHRRHRLVSLHERLVAQLEALMALDIPTRKRPLAEALRGPGWRLIADAGRLLPLDKGLSRQPVYPWELLASTLDAMGCIKSLLEPRKSASFDKTHRTYRRRDHRAYDE